MEKMKQQVTWEIETRKQMLQDFSRTRSLAVQPLPLTDIGDIPEGTLSQQEYTAWLAEALRYFLDYYGEEYTHLKHANKRLPKNERIYRDIPFRLQTYIDDHQPPMSEDLQQAMLADAEALHQHVWSWYQQHQEEVQRSAPWRAERITAYQKIQEEPEESPSQPDLDQVAPPPKEDSILPQDIPEQQKKTEKELLDDLYNDNPDDYEFPRQYRNNK